jgi:sugar phosphate isomerase/epimerase
MQATTTTLSRRGLLAGAAGGAAAAALTPALGQATGRRRGRIELLVPRQNIGIQLYTVRDLADADLPGLLALLASIGYPEVEPFSYHGRTPAQFRALLDANKLRAIGFHVGADRFRNELETVLDEAELLGQFYVGVSFVTLPGDPNINLAAYQRFAEEFNTWGEAAANRGLRFYFHNHGWDFTVERGRALYDVLLAETDPDLVFFELDIYWMINGFPANGVAGRDPVDYLTGRYPQSRWPLFHVKDRTAAGDFTDPGTGTIDFARIFSVLDNKHYHHYLVERDTLAHSAETARIGYEYLRNLRGRRRSRCDGHGRH